jgi:uncharacterized protein YjlB
MDVERAKNVLEKVTGLGRPDVTEVTNLLRRRKAIILPFAGDGETPNNPHLPVILYRSPVKLAKAFDPAAIFEVLFNGNYWGHSWRDGMYNYLHWHSGTHEVLGIVRGTLNAKLGGRGGRAVRLRVGDVVVLPAGIGHCRLAASDDLLVVGAYPEGSDYDEGRPRDAQYASALAMIDQVALPLRDPVYGEHGPLVDVWKRESKTAH